MSGDPVSAPAPQAGGSPEVLDVERASASPIPPPAPPRASRRPFSETASLDLRTAQAWFVDAVSWPGSLRGGARVAARRHGVALEAVCAPGAKISALDGLDVYHYAYRARLVEALADDYGALRNALGAAAFEAFAAKVIALHPSRTRDLNAYGRVVVEALRSGAARVRHRAFLTALAELEWALVEAVHAPPPPVSTRIRSELSLPNAGVTWCLRHHRRCGSSPRRGRPTVIFKRSATAPTPQFPGDPRARPRSTARGSRSGGWTSPRSRTGSWDDWCRAFPSGKPSRRSKGGRRPRG